MWRRNQYVEAILLVMTVCGCPCKAERVVMKADVVRDFPEHCYDVHNCRPRRVNETWILGPCELASCEIHQADKDMLLEVHYSCPRFQARGLTTYCQMIEDLRLVFPWCCPRIVCSHPLTLSTATTTTTVTDSSVPVTNATESSSTDLSLNLEDEHQDWNDITETQS